MAPNEILIENDYWNDWKKAGRSQMVKCDQRWLNRRSPHLPHTVVPDGTFTVGLCKYSEMPHIIPNSPYTAHYTFVLFCLFAACVHLDTWEWSGNRTAKAHTQVCHVTIMFYWNKCDFICFLDRRLCRTTLSGSVFIPSCIQAQSIEHSNLHNCIKWLLLSTNHKDTCNHSSKQNITD